MMYRMRSVIVTVGVLLMTSRQAVAQQSTDLESRLAQRLDAETNASVMRVLQNAKQLELPIEPIVSKALLGAAFKQPSSVITQTVNVELERLVASRDALAPRPSSNDIKAGAEAIALGVPSETIKDLRAKFPERSMVVPLAVLGELVANKVPVQKAAAMVKDFMRRGASEAQLVAFSEKVRDDIARGASPTEALAARTEGLIARLPTAPAAGAAAADALAPGSLTTGGKKRP